MKIIHLTTQDSGGAGRACIRLHKALLKENIDSIVLTTNKTSDLPSVRRVAKSKIQKAIEKLRPHLSQLPLNLYKQREKDIFSPNIFFFNLKNKNLINMVNELEPDLIHLHWIEGGFLNIKDLKYFKAPILWSLHDANPYTGGCHYVASSCIGVSNHCGTCPLLKSSFKYDISFFTFKNKKSTYKKLNNLTINGLSKWIANCASESTLFKDKRIINLPNPIDVNVFKPLNKFLSREILKINKNKKIISFGAINNSIPRKGWRELKNAMESLNEKTKENLLLLIFGSSEEDIKIQDIPSHNLGVVADDITLNLIYSATDIFIMPSHLESFGQMALESLSCGTPVVAFDTSGLKDIITHKITGYLAQCYDPLDLKNGIEWILNLDESKYRDISNNARSSVIDRFESSKIAKQYIKTYEKIIRGGVEEYKLLAKLTLLSIISSNHKKIIGFGAIGGTSIRRKGFKELFDALELIQNKEKYELLIFGGEESKLPNIKTNIIGHVGDDNTLSLIYNACDVFVVPSLNENLSNTIMESLSCGVPVVAFNIGGNSSLINHKVNGYLSKDIFDLKNGIEWILNLDESKYRDISNNARSSVIDRFESSKIAKQYIQAYNKLLGGGEYELEGCLCILLYLNSSFKHSSLFSTYLLSSNQNRKIA